MNVHDQIRPDVVVTKWRCVVIFLLGCSIDLTLNPPTDTHHLQKDAF